MLPTIADSCLSLLKKALTIVVFCLPTLVFGQTSERDKAAVSRNHEVSGIVIDSLGNPVAQAKVILFSATDSVKIDSDGDGIFLFPKVKSSVFFLTVSKDGYFASTTKYLYNPATEKIVLEPFVLRRYDSRLREVVVHGTPTVNYKKDTVEFRASDYKVDQNATVEDLIKKMDGIEVSRDGTVTHQGKTVTKVKLNGKDYFMGNVSQAVQTLPAEIVEKIQVINDYGDFAARTGFQSGSPKKSLNIVTKAERSNGYLAMLKGAGGNNRRYDSRLMGINLNGNRQIAVVVNATNTLNGIAAIDNNGAGSNASTGSINASVGNSSNMSSGTGGTTSRISTALNFRDQLSPKTQANNNYVFSQTEVNATNSSTAQQFSTLGTTYINTSEIHSAKKVAHNYTTDFEYFIDDNNYLKISPLLVYQTSNSLGSSIVSQTGLAPQNADLNNAVRNTNQFYQADAFFQHTFKDPRQTLYIQLINYLNKQDGNDKSNDKIAYLNSSGGMLSTAFLNNTIVSRNDEAGHGLKAGYIQPFSSSGKIEVNQSVNFNLYKNTVNTLNSNEPSNLILIDSLSNVFSYSYFESQSVFDYHMVTKKIDFSVGASAVLVSLSSANKRIFNVIPVLRFNYQIASSQSLSFYYNRSSRLPTFNQLNPKPNYTNAQNVVVGNPGLQPAFVHEVNANYNNYLPNQRLNLSLGVGAGFVTQNIVQNTVISRSQNDIYTYRTYFDNYSTAKSLAINYNISKQLKDRVYQVQLNGTIILNHESALSNSAPAYVNTSRFNERLGLQITPDETWEINPYIAYDVTQSESNLPNALITTIKKTSVSLDGKISLGARTAFKYSFSKNYINGISSNVSRNPLIIDAAFERTFFAKKNGTLSLQVFDLLGQNNYINRRSSSTGFVDSKTNTLSRYFLLSFSMNLQKWAGAPHKAGKVLKRRGDGSFIN